MAEENNGANVPEVAEPVNVPAEVDTVETKPAEGDASTNSEVVPTKPKQSREDNAAYANMRRQMEAASKRAETLEKESADHKALMQAIGDVYGFSGTPSQVRDMIVANDRGISVEQLNAERAAQEAQTRKLVESDPEYQRTLQENKRLRDAVIRDRMAKDLETLKSANPDLKIESLDDLGEDFEQLIGLGWNAKEAYAAMQAKSKANLNTPPASTGPIKSPPSTEKEFYTPEEVDRITREDLRKDPALMDKIKKSMARW